MYLISSAYVIGFLALLAGVRKVREKQPEHALTRAIISIFFFILASHPDIPVETARVVSRTLYGLLFLIEIISWLAISYFRRKNKK